MSIDQIYVSSAFDNRLVRQELDVIIAHARALERGGVIGRESYNSIVRAARTVRDDTSLRGTSCDGFEDVYAFIEHQMRLAGGDDVVAFAGIGKARNDSSVTSLKLWMRQEYVRLGGKLAQLVELFVARAESSAQVVMPGFTHSQVAQPLSLAHYFLAYAQMFLRDLEKVRCSHDAMNECPLGSAALAGTCLPIDRTLVAELLGFDRPALNTLDAVSDRDFVMDGCYVASSVMLHLSRFAEELIVWSGAEYGMFRLPDAVVTRSSILPHKRSLKEIQSV